MTTDLRQYQKSEIAWHWAIRPRAGRTTAALVISCGKRPEDQDVGYEVTRLAESVYHLCNDLHGEVYTLDLSRLTCTCDGWSFKNLKRLKALRNGEQPVQPVCKHLVSLTECCEDLALLQIHQRPTGAQLAEYREAGHDHGIPF